jgi:pyridoxal phosphate enzyme (YggS family)
MNIQENLVQFREKIKGQNCVLVAISKTKTVSDILEAYNSGLRDFGENKVQELLEKHDQLPRDIRWHMVGHLQTNKVKLIVPFIGLIHSVDSHKLLLEIDKQAGKAGRIIPCLLQVHIGEEETKFGMDPGETLNLIGHPGIKELKHIIIKGLMGIATFTDDMKKVGEEFRFLKKLYDQARTINVRENIKIDTLSMGMSSDYETALKEGSNMIRIGTAIFGERKYDE